MESADLVVGVVHVVGALRLSVALCHKQQSNSYTYNNYRNAYTEEIEIQHESYTPGSRSCACSGGTAATACPLSYPRPSNGTCGEKAASCTVCKQKECYWTPEGGGGGRGKPLPSLKCDHRCAVQSCLIPPVRARARNGSHMYEIVFIRDQIRSDLGCVPPDHV